MNFNQALKTYDSDFENILTIMKLMKDSETIDSARNLLKTADIILDYFINREDESLKVPVIYFPICFDYAQELCEDFITLKLGLFSNGSWKRNKGSQLSRNYAHVPSNLNTKKQRNLFLNNYQFEQKLSRILLQSKETNVDLGRSIIYSERLQRDYNKYFAANRNPNGWSVDRYWYLHHAISDSDEFLKGECPLSIINTDTGSLYDKIIDNNGVEKIQNIVVFPLGSADGRYSPICTDSFQKCYLDDYVSTGCGLKNVLFFCFSRKPYRLRRLFDFKQRMQERIQIFNDAAFDFISFTYEESTKWSYPKIDNHITLNIGKENNSLQSDFESLFDDVTSGIDRPVSRRNEMSLCVNDDIYNEYCNRILYETEIDESILSQIFNFNKQLWKENIGYQLDHFLFEKSVCVITGYDIDDKLKSNFKDFLKEQYQIDKVEYGTFHDLKGYLIDGVYQNTIKQERILVMSFRADYTESIFHKYPNSFDPFCINSDQLLLEIPNYFYLRQFYDWGIYNYGKAIRNILKSDFRKSEMTPVLKGYAKPKKQILNNLDDQEEETNASRAVQKIRVIYKNDHQQELFKSELVLCKIDNCLRISPLSDLCDLYGNLDNLEIQPFSPLINWINTQCIESKRDNDNRNEKMFKGQSIYGLNENEISSDTQLWKILLAKRVNEFGSKEVYDAIMANLKERYKVSYFSFKRWLEPDYGIPRAKLVQKTLIEQYLDIKPPYLKLIRRIKERTKSNTSEITTQIKSFLNIALLSTDYTSVFSALNEETKDLLGIDEPTDVKSIITDVKEQIHFKPVKSICYDN